MTNFEMIKDWVTEFSAALGPVEEVRDNYLRVVSYNQRFSIIVEALNNGICAFSVVDDEPDQLACTYNFDECDIDDRGDGEVDFTFYLGGKEAGVLEINIFDPDFVYEDEDEDWEDEE